MVTFDDLRKNAFYTDEDEAIASITNNKLLTTRVDMGFRQVDIKQDADKSLLIEYIKDRTKPGKGAFQEVSLERLSQGLSYIELGAWIGNQTDALVFMALGAHHGAWSIITPMLLGMTGPEAEQMMGAGMVMTSGITPEFRALLEA